MAALNDVLGYAIDADRGFVFSVRESSRLAAIVQSLLQMRQEEQAHAPQWTWGYWSVLANCDPVSARYVIEQLSAVTENDSAARVAVVAMETICLCLLAPTTEAPHAP